MIRVVGKGRWREREMGKFQVGTFLFMLERALRSVKEPISIPSSIVAFRLHCFFQSSIQTFQLLLYFPTSARAFQVQSFQLHFGV